MVEHDFKIGDTLTDTGISTKDGTPQYLYLVTSNISVYSIKEDESILIKDFLGRRGNILLRKATEREITKFFK